MRKHSTRTWISLGIAAQAFGFVALWMGGPAATPVQAQGIPDAGAQQQQIIDQLKSTNAKLDRLITLLAERKVQVTLSKTDEAGRNR